MKNQHKVIDKEGKTMILQRFTYKQNTKELFHPRNSNWSIAGTQSKALIAKSVRKGAYQDLITQVEEAVQEKVLVEVPPEKYQELQQMDHHFTFIHYVQQPLSSSTKFRMVVNTSTLIPNQGTTIGLYTEAPSRSLNVMETGIIRFLLYGTPLIGDLRKA